VAEQEHMDAAYARLQELRTKAQQLASEAHWRDEDYVVDSLFERDVVANQAAHRLAALNVPKGRMAVGRIDLDDGESWCIGRLAVADAAGDPMVVDWRAPAAEPFYRAVPGDPMEVVRRRHYRWRGDDLVGLDDEVFDAAGVVRNGLGLVGEGALLAALAAPRTGRMTDVVATIQAEQDRVIRRPKAGVLVVQGAPGTGKTAVALHRAAYLLYGEHNAFSEHAILFVGPNATFLRYVEEVVPSLGEDRVVLVTPSELGPDVVVDREETADVTRLKGDARMATVLRRAIAGYERAPREPVRVPCGRFTLELTVDALKAVAARGRRATGRHNDRRRLVERALVGALQDAFDRAEAREVKYRRIGQLSGRNVLDAIDTRAVATIVDRLWPILTPERVLTALHTNESRRRHAGRDVLTDDEVALLDRPADDLSWSDADVALLDEIVALVGDVPARRAKRRRAGADPIVERVLADYTPDCPVCATELTFVPGGEGIEGDRLRCDVCEPVRYFRPYDLLGDAKALELRVIHDSIVTRNVSVIADSGRPGDTTYGHVVVDEAQDLSAMQWRALARRCPSFSMTVAGDQGQAIRPGGTGTWEAAVEALGAPAFDLAELTVNYRTPIEVMQAAEAVLAAAAVPYSTTRSVRSTQDPIVTVVDAITPAVVQDVLDRIDVGGGTVQVIAPRARCEALGAIDVVEAKGLEFDAVVVVDPDAIAAEGEGGARRVYVAMTRTTNVLHIVKAA
jgi:DNA helicase IV